MRELNLSEDENELLIQVLEQSLSALEREILHTDHALFRETLKHRRMLLEGLCARLRQPHPASR